MLSEMYVTKVKHVIQPKSSVDMHRRTLEHVIASQIILGKQVQKVKSNKPVHWNWNSQTSIIIGNPIRV